MRLAVLPPSAAAEQEALRLVLQWLRAGDTFVWVGIKQQARAARAHITYSYPYCNSRTLLARATLRHQAAGAGCTLLARATLTTRLSAGLLALHLLLDYLLHLP